MKKYKIIKTISVVFALLTLVNVFLLSFVELMNVDMAKDFDWFVNICETLKIDMTDDYLKENLMHYATVLLSVNYILTFLFWCITFKIGSSTIVQAKKETRQALRNSSATVRVNTEKDLAAIRKEQRRQERKAEKEQLRAEKKAAREAAKKETEEVTDETDELEVVTNEVETTKKSTETKKTNTKIDDILDSLK